MNIEKDKWKKAVLESMKDSQKAKPRPELYGMVEKQIFSQPIQLIPIHQWKKYVAAASVVLLLNISAIFYYSQNKIIPLSSEMVATYIDSETFITSYQIYE